MRTMPPEWHVAVFPLPPVQRDVLAPSGKPLRVFAPNVALPREARTGPWPEGAIWQSWFKSPSGRRCLMHTSRWHMHRWEDRESEGDTLLRIHIYLDYGGAYSWDTRGRCTTISYHLGDEPGVLGLEAAFEQWQSRYDDLDPRLSDSQPSEWWDALEEDGLALCLELARWVGLEGYVIYDHPPTRLEQGDRPLVLAWEPTNAVRL